MTYETSTSAEEAAIRGVIEAVAKALREKDVEAMMARCTRDIATFDLVPPLKHTGAEAVRRGWEKAVAGFKRPLEYEVQQLEITVEGNVAFTRSLNRFGGTLSTGERVANWLCTTLGWRKIEGQWKIAHQHVSVPFDMETKKALLDLQP